jgi:hypothetical protein
MKPDIVPRLGTPGSHPTAEAYKLGRRRGQPRRLGFDSPLVLYWTSNNKCFCDLCDRGVLAAAKEK